MSSGGIVTAAVQRAVITTRCNIHPARPDRVPRTLEIKCIRCKDAITVNFMNPGWAAAGYVPVQSWDGADAFLLAAPR